jgi:hypothetical protein
MSKIYDHLLQVKTFEAYSCINLIFSRKSSCTFSKFNMTKQKPGLNVYLSGFASVDAFLRRFYV